MLIPKHSTCMCTCNVCVVCLVARQVLANKLVVYTLAHISPKCVLKLWNQNDKDWDVYVKYETQ